MFLSLEHTGKGLSDELAFKKGRYGGRRVAGCNGEHVDEFQDEETRECAAEVADAVSQTVKSVYYPHLAKKILVAVRGEGE